jgi:hypothetical protein
MAERLDPTRPDATVADVIDACLAAGGPGADAWWRGVEALRARGGREVLDAALALCRGAAAAARTLGLDILNQFGSPERSFRDEIFPVLLRALDDDAPKVRQAAVAALGFEDDARVAPALAGRRGDPDPEVRYAIAFALGQRADDPVAVDALVALAHDELATVRDWAPSGSDRSRAPRRRPWSPPSSSAWGTRTRRRGTRRSPASSGARGTTG